MVLQLANRFRTEQGIDCQIDQHFLPAYPAEGWMKWMRDQIDQADFVLMVCTKTYPPNKKSKFPMKVSLNKIYMGDIYGTL